jgi:hypothetical protein
MKTSYAIVATLSLAGWSAMQAMAQTRIGTVGFEGDIELRQIIAPWKNRAENEPSRALSHPDLETLKSYFATSDKWRLAYQNGDLVATRRYLQNGLWRSSPSERFVNYGNVSGKTHVRSLSLQVFLEGIPPAVSGLLKSNSIVVSSRPDNTSECFVRSLATNYCGVVLFAREQSESENDEVIQNAVRYLELVVDAAAPSRMQKDVHIGRASQSGTSSITVAPGEFEGEYYVRADINAREGGVFYVRIVDDLGIDVVGRKFMFEVSNEVIGARSVGTVQSLYDCVFTLTTSEKAFRDNSEYVLQLCCQKGSNSEDQIISAYRARFKRCER